MHESEKWKGSRSVVSDPQRPHGLQPSRLLHPWDFPGKSTGVGCHCLLRNINWLAPNRSKMSCFPLDPQFSSVAQSCPTLYDPMDSSTPGFPVLHQLLDIAQTHVHWISDAIPHLILCRPLLLLPPIPPSIRVFSSKSTLRMRWPKYWSFSFNIIPSKEHPGLISFRMDWLDLLAVRWDSTLQILGDNLEW